jgi:hypothetical protein
MLCPLKDFTYFYGDKTIKRKSIMTKIQKVSERISPFAGVSLINDEFNACGLSELIT